MCENENKINIQLERYIKDVTKAVQYVLSNDLVGIYLTGSAVFKDLTRKSDLDIMVISARPMQTKQKHQLAKELQHETLHCPLIGLELIVVQEPVAMRPGWLPSFEFAIDTGETWGLNVLYGGEEKELLLEFAICRQYGKTLAGTPAFQIFDTIPRDRLISILKSIIREHEEHVHHPFHDPYGHFGVLNACRALCFAKSNVLCSKTEGGRWALKQLQNTQLIKQALDVRLNQSNRKLNKKEVIAFLRRMYISVE